MVANAVLLVTDDRMRSADVPALLAGNLACDMVDLDATLLAAAKTHKAVIFDVDLGDHDSAQKLQAALSKAGKGGPPRIFLTEEVSHHARVQAAAFGGAAVINRPIKLQKLLLAIFGPPPEPAPVIVSGEVVSASKAAAGTVANLFDAMVKDAPIDLRMMEEEGDMIDAALIRGEITQWIAAVREHHSYTYRHCMLVAGVTAAFTQHLGIGAACRRRLMRGALLHDVGKARIPVAILDKPDKLTEAELQIMRTHPARGREFLRKHHSGETELIDIVYRHHERLDGSGYPEALKAADISDAVRLISICDVYAALIEPRPYKAQSTKAEAFAIMEGMHGKLDGQLLSAFKPIALGDL
ncbi:phosphohydrolase [Terrihabitans soli]|uniref:Phosphohydrolase n=1 Tax=Terrihabitans soli TaxID=708113 RepID=A0A6S6QUQ2_9HYPH|nr:HD domain-containing phosphohydrolase [Terrihabitans soli]BCJ90680.1 phosphohydrolase [Terrihabitans soli]